MTANSWSELFCDKPSSQNAYEEKVLRFLMWWKYTVVLEPFGTATPQGASSTSLPSSTLMGVTDWILDAEIHVLKYARM
ncbi:hypothetical protein STEG23_004491 [Scotinomys teguina]